MRLRPSVVVAFALLLCAGIRAFACSCMQPGPVCSIAMGSSSIFRGTVIESTLIPAISTVPGPDGKPVQVVGNGTFKVRFSVAETFSGAPASEQIVYTSQRGSACGFPFQVGREYVVFTYLNNAQLWTSRCSRTALLEAGVENKAVTWMRAYKTAPHGSEIFGSFHLPAGGGSASISATLELSGPESRTVETDAGGKYAIPNLKAGDYHLAARVPDGFATQPPAKVTLGEKGCAEIVWFVTYEGRIRGRVIDLDGNPVADLTLELEFATGARNNLDHRATTNLDGSYEFRHLSPGNYLVVARNPASLVEDGPSNLYYPHSQKAEAQAIPVGVAAHVDGIDFVLPRLRPTPKVTVRVVLPDGSPAPEGLSLFAFPNGTRGNEATRSGLTDSSGMAVLPLFYQREYAISVALDRQHPGCGFAVLTFSEQKKVGTVVIAHPEACTK